MCTTNSNKFWISMVLVVAVCVSQGYSQSCAINLKTALKKGAPIIVKNDRLIDLSHTTFNLANRDSVTLACPGTGNSIRGLTPARQSVEVSCAGGSFEVLGNTRTTFPVMNCAQANPKVEVITTYERCGNNKGKMKTVTFKYDTTNIELYRTCYNKDRFEALYTVHDIQGKYWDRSQRCEFSEVGSNLPSGHTVAGLYDNQQAQLQKLVGRKVSDYYRRGSKFLARGHFAACSDFNYPALMTASFLYINAAPEWQTENAGNWRRIETKVKNMVTNGRYNKLRVYTGASDVLQLDNDRSLLVDIFLGDNQKLPVPKYFWKVVFNEQQHGIAFVMLNNPYNTDANHFNGFCTNVCATGNFAANEFNEPRKGLVICCSVAEAKAKIGIMDKVPSASAILVS